MGVCGRKASCKREVEDRDQQGKKLCASPSSNWFWGGQHERCGSCGRRLKVAVAGHGCFRVAHSHTTAPDGFVSISIRIGALSEGLNSSSGHVK